MLSHNWHVRVGIWEGCHSIDYRDAETSTVQRSMRRLGRPLIFPPAEDHTPFYAAREKSGKSARRVCPLLAKQGAFVCHALGGLSRGIPSIPHLETYASLIR